MENIIENSEIKNVKPIRDIVYEQLRKAILRGKINAGERIVEKEYADKLNISRTPVREALRKLEMEGFVEYIPRKGVVVKSFNLDDINEIYEIRKTLECLAIKNVIKNIDEQTIDALKDILHRVEKLEEQGDIKGVFDVSLEFNNIIRNASSMPRLVQMINNLQEFIERFRRVTMSKDSRRHQAMKEHKEILEAIIEKDVEKAQRLVYNHINNSQIVCLEEFQSSLE